MVYILLEELAGFHLLDIHLQYDKAFFGLIHSFLEGLAYADSQNLFISPTFDPPISVMYLCAALLCQYMCWHMTTCDDLFNTHRNACA